jgi:hypothetical protein
MILTVEEVAAFRRKAEYSLVQISKAELLLLVETIEALRNAGAITH